MPKGFEIDQNKIRNDIIESFINEKELVIIIKLISFDDYQFPFSQPLQWLQDYIRDHLKAEYGFQL